MDIPLDLQFPTLHRALRRDLATVQPAKAIEAFIVKIEDILVGDRELGGVRRAIARGDGKAAVVQEHVVVGAAGVRREVDEPIARIPVDADAGVLAVRGRRRRLEAACRVNVR